MFRSASSRTQSPEPISQDGEVVEDVEPNAFTGSLKLLLQAYAPQPRVMREPNLDASVSSKYKRKTKIKEEYLQPFDSTMAYIEGYMEKLGSRAKWQRRYFLLRRDAQVLYYFNSLEELTLLGAYNLAAEGTELAKDESVPGTFVIECEGKKHVIRTYKDEDFQEWYKRSLEVVYNPGMATKNGEEEIQEKNKTEREFAKTSIRQVLETGRMILSAGVEFKLVEGSLTQPSMAQQLDGGVPGDAAAPQSSEGAAGDAAKAKQFFVGAKWDEGQMLPSPAELSISVGITDTVDAADRGTNKAVAVDGDEVDIGAGEGGASEQPAKEKVVCTIPLTCIETVETVENQGAQLCLRYLAITQAFGGGMAVGMEGMLGVDAGGGRRGSGMQRRASRASISRASISSRKGSAKEHRKSSSFLGRRFSRNSLSSSGDAASGDDVAAAATVAAAEVAAEDAGSGADGGDAAGAGAGGSAAAGVPGAGSKVSSFDTKRKSSSFGNRRRSSSRRSVSSTVMARQSTGSICGSWVMQVPPPPPPSPTPAPAPIPCTVVQNLAVCYRS
jgi:hypothetical protein